jgi:hypothetical protein
MRSHVFLPLSDFMVFPYEISCFWVVMRFRYEFVVFCSIIVWWDETKFCRCEISIWDFMLFVAYFVVIWNASKSVNIFALVARGFGREFSMVARRCCKGMHESEFGRRWVVEYILRRGAVLFVRYEISWWDFILFWPLWVPVWDFMIFAAQLLYEISWWDFKLLGPLRALRMRFHACLARMWCLDEISCFLATGFSFWWCDVRMVERWILKDADDWVYKMVYWTLRGFVCASWVVRWRGKWM